ncbi:uncharacterized protein LOC135499827 isoform X2 [Lineus longissimus]|uniref:uncharacterized protein LOC135499827 isoform X2 n=1 Tax=Lineus longissimus TaxID=88925 RepID=UPI00315C67E3
MFKRLKDISLGTTNTDTFEVLNISKVLGLAALKEHCENLVSQSLCAENACGYLTAALRNGKTDDILRADSFANRCVDFILENAEKCVMTTGWLQLTKEALIRIISTDTFSLKEEEVWRAVLSWAKYNADIPLDKQSQDWKEAEKCLLKKHLQGIIEHVRLLLIDSKVFAEEIESTGLIPMEVSLERYRLAAVPDQIQQSRLRPRTSAQLFLGTHILCKGHLPFQRLLNNWYGDATQTWRLLYRARRDGSTSDWFHKLCDGYSTTFVIVKGKTGNIFGGFSDVPWTSQTPPAGAYKTSNRSFIFSLVNNAGNPPTKYNIKRQKYAVVNHRSHGPIFGAGADLSIASNCLDGEECYSNLPHSYDGENVSNLTLNGTQYFDIEDYEVFTLKENII